MTELDAKSFDHAWNPQDFTDELKKDYSYYIIAEKNNTPCGYAGIWCIYETADLMRIAVSPDFRRKGIADMLMRDILAHAAEKGCERMMLEVRASNTGAQALYTKHNFNKISVRHDYYDGEDAVIMERNLT